LGLGNAEPQCPQQYFTLFSYLSIPRTIPHHEDEKEVEGKGEKGRNGQGRGKGAGVLGGERRGRARGGKEEMKRGDVRKRWRRGDRVSR
jgi:hypothetical protein